MQAELLQAFKNQLFSWSESPRDWVIRVSAATFLLLFTLIFVFDRSMSFGMSLGFFGFLIRAGVLALATLIAALCSSLFLYFRSPRSLWPNLAYAALVLVSSVALDFAMLDEADARFGMGTYVAAQKTEYFCFKRFNARQCVRHVNACPSCALQMDKWKRDRIAEKLKNINRSLASAAKPRQ